MFNNRKKTLTVFILANLALMAGQAVAQEATQEEKQEASGQAADQSAQDPATAQQAAPAQGGGQVTDLKGLVVTGQILYRDRAETVAPELVYDREFFQKFEPVSVGDQLRRVPGVAFTSDIGESDSPQMRGLGLGYTHPDGRLLAVDDPGLAPLFEKAGELGMPIAIHIGDPKAFWLAPTPDNERYD